MPFDECSADDLVVFFNRHVSDPDSVPSQELAQRFTDAARHFLGGLDRQFVADPEQRLQARHYVESAFDRLVECNPTAATTRAEFMSEFAAAIRRVILDDARSRAR
jgi:hypothetical protein